MHKNPQNRVGIKFWHRLFALLAVAALIAAGCGNDDDDPGAAESGADPAVQETPAEEPEAEPESQPEPEPEEEPAEEPEAEPEPEPEEEPAEEPEAEPEPEPEEEPAVELSGDPIKIMTVGSFLNQEFGSDFREQSDGVRAHAAALNAAGGIDGRPIEVIVCNTENDVVKFIDCQRQGIDEGVIAMVGWAGSETADAFALLEEAGIAALGVVTGDQPSLTSPNSFSTNNGAIGQFFGLPAAFRAAGATKASAVVPDVGGAAIAQIQGMWSLGLIQIGIEDGGFVPVPGDVTDMSPVVGTATAGGVDGVAASLIGDLNTRFIQTLRELAPDVKLIIPGGQLDPDIIADIADVAEGALVVSWYPPFSAADTIPGIAQYLAEMEAFDPNQQVTDQSVGYWLAAYLFGEFAKQIVASGQELTSQSMLDALSSASEVDTLGLTPTLDFTQPPAIPFPMDRMFNVNSVFTTLVDGELILWDPENPFTNIFG